MAKAQLTVFADPTVVGKGTAVAALAKRYPMLNVSVPATTRDPWPDRLDGVHYYFVSAQEFDVMIECGDMLEWALIHGNNKYGTPHGPVDETPAANKPVLLEIGLVGARQIRANRPGIQLIFLAPPSREEFERHLIGRGTENPEEQAHCLATARVELEVVLEFDHVMTSDGVEHAVDELARLIDLEQYPPESATERNVRMSGIIAQPVGITFPPIDDLLEHVDSKYTLVIFAVERVCQINSYNLWLQQNMIQFVGPVVDVQPDEKPPVVFLHEINEDLLSLEANPEA